ncbi:MAG: hypothetical protein ACYC46_10775 [Acidobacteriaceae bacterium]
MLRTRYAMETRQRQVMETLTTSTLHRLCQPLTALQCILELGQEQSHPEALRASMRDARSECSRAVAMLSTFRELVEMATRYRMICAVDALELARLHGLSIISAESSASDTSRNLWIAANQAGMELVLQQVNSLLVRLQAETLPILCVEEASVRFCWHWLPDTSSVWQRELKALDPFDFPDPGCMQGSLLALTTAGLVVEAMGGRFLLSEQGIEMAFSRSTAG